MSNHAIHTASDLDALPDGQRIRDTYGVEHQARKRTDGGVWWAHEGSYAASTLIPLPAILIADAEQENAS